jgi:hypothetical protein
MQPYVDERGRSAQELLNLAVYTNGKMLREPLHRLILDHMAKVTQVYNLSSPRDSIEIKKMLDDRPISILVGSGISTFHPTNLPSGQSVTGSIFESLFYDRTNEYQDPQRCEVKKAFNNFPFERVMERCPEQERLRALLSTFFNVEKFNTVHEVLARGLLEKRFESIVTTNYDCCLDAALGFPADCTALQTIGDVTRIVRKEDQFQVSGPQEYIYFKIHGSTGDPTGESLVFTTKQEGALDKWKYDLLKRLWVGRILLIIGYSGLDFEICPAIPRLSPKQVVWNFYEEKDDKSSAIRVLEKTPGAIIIGDMCKLLQPLLGVINVKPGNGKDFKLEILKEFTPLTRLLWRARILVAMTCAGPALRTCRLLSEQDIEDLKSRITLLKEHAGALYYKGAYKQAAHKLESAAAEVQNSASHGFDEAEICNLFLSIYDCWKCYGSFLRARRHLKKAEIFARRCRGASKREVLARLRLKRLHRLSHYYKWAQRLRLTFLAREIQEEARSMIISLAGTFAQAGAQFDFYQMSYWGKQFEIEEEEIAPAGLYAPPPAHEGYTHVGDLMGQMTDFRYEMNKAQLASDPDIMVEAEKLAELAEKLEIYPEAWKIRVLMAKKFLKWQGRNNLRNFWNNIRQARIAFKECEYVVLMRPFFILRRIIG